MFNRPASILAVIISLCVMHNIYAADEGKVFTLAAVINTVLTRHPDLAIGNIDAAISETAAERIEGLLDPTVNASIGVSEDQTPPSSDFQPRETQLGQLSGNIIKPLASGGTLGASLEYNRTKQDFSSPLASQLATINPAYRSSLSLSYRMPLLRGSGRPEYTEALNASMSDIEAGRLQRELIARDLSLQTLNVYFRLLSDGVRVKLAEVTLKRANRLLEYQQFREKFGLIETADRMQAEALLATRKLEVQQARAQQVNDTVELNRLMLRAPDAPLNVVANEQPVRSGIGGLDDSIEDALSQRPEFQILEAQLKATESRLKIARNAKQIQLDVVAEVGTLALNEDAGNAAADTFSTADHFAGVSLELSDRLGRRVANADLRETELARQRVLAQRTQVKELIRDELAGVLSALTTGEEILKLARLSVEAEKKKFEAELSRYREGRSDTTTVIQFEGELHVAELQAELQLLSLLLADKQYAWAKGVLLDELGIQVPPYEGVMQ